MLKKSALGAVAVAVLISSSAYARPKKEDAAQTGDPNRIICRSQNTTGSRLGNEKVCLTAAQWAEQKRVTRDSVERAQYQGYSRAN